MRSLLGLLWALGGAVAGFIVGVLVAIVILKITSPPDREGAHGYFMMAFGIIGVVAGVVVGLVLYGRSAPAGQGIAYTGSGTLGMVALVAAIAISIWAFLNLREAPLEYGGSLANLEMELRFKSTEIPADVTERWLDIEVQTAKTRPVGTVLWDKKRTEGEYTIVPVVQGPLYRSGSRVIVVRIEGRQVEVFMPPMKRTPDRKADWSEWYRPRAVDNAYGVDTKTPLQSIMELRYRVRGYGD